MSGNVEITIFWKQKRNGDVKVETSLDKVPEDKRDSFTTLTAVMAPITWGDHNDLQAKCTRKSDDGKDDDLDWAKYKEEKLKKILVSWDAKDSLGNLVPVSSAAILSLHPKVAETLISEYDSRTLLGEKEKRVLVGKIHSYYFSSILGAGTADAPPELIEIGLMEKFGWTPNQIDAISFGKLQRIFVSMEQKDRSIEDAQSAKAHSKPAKKSQR